VSSSLAQAREFLMNVCLPQSCGEYVMIPCGSSPECYSSEWLLLLRAQRSIHRLREKGPDKQIQIVFAKNRRFLIALYFSHPSVFSYKNLTLCRESFMFLEYPNFF
jgi:hypothetical protein